MIEVSFAELRSRYEANKDDFDVLRMADSGKVVVVVELPNGNTWTYRPEPHTFRLLPNEHQEYLTHLSENTFPAEDVVEGATNG